MIHLFAGNLGHILVIASFISSVLATYAFARNLSNPTKKWAEYAKWVYYVHAFGIFGIVGVLFYIISSHYFEYHYVYNYTSKILPIYYQVSSFWNGQEGSFLLWMFWNAVLGLIIIHTNRSWRAPVMMVFTFTQVFLVSMILGVVVFDVKIGSSPFLLLRDVVKDPVFQINPNFVPEDGRGLNPLLQNYWMVIHPPTLFLGFATTVVPFAFAIAGLITGRFKEWIRPALPWAQFSAAVLGLGILMGAYWAYETLNFGGYWNWDPVENAIYVPWLVMVAAIHTMIAFKKNSSALKISILLVITTYILIVYSTFLTRSGVLGNASVHSFTDLGLSGQLLIYLFVFIVLSVFVCVRAWKNLPKNDEELATFSREFWIFMGATTLCLMAFQVILPTSIPVWNELVELIGVRSNLAPPADQIGFYTKFQLYFAIVIAILSGTGQFFWWKKMDRKKLREELTIPVLLALICSAGIFILGKVHDLPYLLLLTSAIYSIIANSKVLLNLRKSNIKLSGGSVSHIGIALMLIGILFSSGYSKILSKNNTGLLWSKDFPDEVNQNNLLLFLNEPREMGEYSMTYRGLRKLTSNYGYIDSDDVSNGNTPLELVVERQTTTSSNEVLNDGDTTQIINPENSYFEIDYVKSDGKRFTLYPRVQINETMDMIVYSPDIKRTVRADFYTHVRTFPDPEQEIEWSETEEIAVSPGDQFFINDYVANFKKIQTLHSLPNVTLGPDDFAIKAIIEVQGEVKKYTAEPIYIIKNNMAGRIPYDIGPLGARISIQSIDPNQNAFVFGLNRTQKDWIIIEAISKPWINVLWLGTFFLMVGFGIATTRRYTEFKKMRDKE